MAGIDVRLIVIGLLVASHGSSAKVLHKVRCEGDEWMTVELVKPEDTTAIYLDQMRGFPDESCQPIVEDGKATFRLPLKDVFRCGVTRIYNRMTDQRVYHQKIVMESKNSHGGTSKEIVFVKCIIGGVSRNKRNVLPAGFKEPEVLDITTSLTEYAPEPLLSAGVRQGGRPVTGELSVSPGASLQLEISLDPVSAPVYGLLVGHLAVSDTKTQEETIIFNGCSVDPYLFENFNTVDGDLLTAKFRAFKFPESSYVQFKGTVNVCLDKCKGVKCSNGQLGYGRKRRAVSQLPADPNKVFEVSMSTLIKVDYDGKDLFENGEMKGTNSNNITFLNGMEPRSFTVGIVKDEEERTHLHRNDATVVREELEYKVFEEQVSHASGLGIHWAVMVFVALTTLARAFSW